MSSTIPRFYVNHGSNNLTANLQHPIPIGINKIVIHKTTPNAPITIAQGTLIKSQIHAVNNAPVTLYPIHKITLNIPSIMINSNIFISPFMFHALSMHHKVP